MKRILLLMFFIIGSVSIYDSYWTFKNADHMFIEEQNPVGKFLIDVDDNSVALFMTCKMLSTVIVIYILGYLYHHKKELGFIIATSVAFFQLVLFIYLTFYPFEHIDIIKTLTQI